jgi:UDP-N-acetyl-D-glucosamine dehydrogenase
MVKAPARERGRWPKLLIAATLRILAFVPRVPFQQVEPGVPYGAMTHGPSSERELIDRFEARDALVGVVGLGYVGLPVAVAFAEAGFRVIGVDPDRARVEAGKAGRSYLHDVEDDRLAAAQAAGKLDFSTSFRGLARADAVLICVPTPLIDGQPDLSAIEAAARSLGKVIGEGTLVVLESTTYPGTTEEVVLPLLEAGGRSVGTDVLLAYSPERIDPGNPLYGFQDIPKVVGGVTPSSTQAAEALYSQVVPKVVTVSGPREAEMAKLLENVFRHVNIALVNELATYAHELDIDIWEAIEAAATKPFGYMPFFPGPGWGGHCIPLDPAYLSWRVRQDRAHEVKFVELAQTVNSEMPRYVVERVGTLLNDRHKSVRGSRILGIGAAYKGGTEDVRGSPALKVLAALERKGATVSYHDPLVTDVEIGGRSKRSVPLSARTVRSQDLVVILARQSGVDWDLLLREAHAILDCCNALGRAGGSVERL